MPELIYYVERRKISESQLQSKEFSFSENPLIIYEKWASLIVN